MHTCLGQAPQVFFSSPFFVQTQLTTVAALWALVPAVAASWAFVPAAAALWAIVPAAATPFPGCGELFCMNTGGAALP